MIRRRCRQPDSPITASGDRQYWRREKSRPYLLEISRFRLTHTIDWGILLRLPLLGTHNRRNRSDLRFPGVELIWSQLASPRLLSKVVSLRTAPLVRVNRFPPEPGSRGHCLINLRLL